MTVLESLALYSSLILAGALGGAVVPLELDGERRRVGFLALAAGVMLGAAFFHMVPEAFHAGGYGAFTWVPVGFGLMFVLERYLITHACEEPPGCEEHTHGNVLGLAAFIGMSVHTLFDGIALGSAVSEGVGLTAFIAIFAHKVPSSLSLATLFRSGGWSKQRVLLAVAAFACMVPVGATLYYLVKSALPFQSFAAKALAFSAGSFLYIAISDLLPHVNRHGKATRGRNLLGMALGLFIMFALSLVTGHEHG